ncbi:DUF2860 family protein [Thaumasiovibrio subtropicus]|uniref:DUF2860 family protein n=1 Tax=Thaumasiovibrio subtropicus TaxID=1891207 RepID=UPI000B350006|nr:DUF2860 family protein [Thaumasiovibrio subtropicus]
MTFRPLRQTLMLSVPVATAIALFAQPSYAQATNTDDGQFYGNIGLYVGMSGERNALSTESNSLLPSLGITPDSDSEAVFIPMWDLNYRWTQHEVYYKTDIVGMASDFYTQLGYRYYLTESSYLAVGYVPGLLTKEAWADPYAVGVERQETDLSVNGWVFNYHGAFGTPYNLEIALGQREIDDEQSGQQAGFNTDALSREGDLLYAAVSREHALSEIYGLEWEVHYLTADMKSDAMANDRIGGEIEMTAQFGRQITKFGVSAARQDYDGINPLFNQTRKDTHIGLSATYIYAAPFNWQSSAFVARAGWDETRSNIDFYDSEEWLVTVGMNYRF